MIATLRKANSASYDLVNRAVNNEQRGNSSAAVLLRQIERRFGPPDETLRARIAAADADTLMIWSERILQTLDDVLH